MLPVLVVIGSGSCARQEILSNPVTFAEFNISTGAAICFPNIPPHTSLIFKQIPPALITARYLAGGREVSLSGDSLTGGFDAGHCSATLDVIPSQRGTLSYFAVSFPADCGTRIVSSLPQEVFVESGRAEKVCYFSGGAKKLEYVIELSGGAGALAESLGLGLKLTGNETRWLHKRDPSIIAWSGNVSSIRIAVFGGQPDNRAVSHVLKNHDPVMIPLQSDGSDGQERWFSWREQYPRQGQHFSEQDRMLPYRGFGDRGGRWRHPGRIGLAHEDWHWQQDMAEHAWTHRPMGLLVLWFMGILWVFVASLCCVIMHCKRKQYQDAQDIAQRTLMPSVVYVASPGSQPQGFIPGQAGVQFQQPSQVQFQQPPFQIQPQTSVPIDPMYQYGVPIFA